MVLLIVVGSDVTGTLRAPSLSQVVLVLEESFPRAYTIPTPPNMIHITPHKIQSNNRNVLELVLVATTGVVVVAGGDHAKIMSFSWMSFFTSGVNVVSGST